MGGFDTFDDYVTLMRVTDLVLSRDGTRLVATVAELNDDGDSFVESLWEIDPAGVGAARRLTRSDKGESTPSFHRDGSLLFVSKRDGADDEPEAALWRLPALGEAERVFERPGGIAGVVTAPDSDIVITAVTALAGSVTVEQDADRRKARKDAKTRAVLHTSSPVRYWDHDLGPEQGRLLALDLGTTPARDLTPVPGRALDSAALAVTPDGSRVITTWAVLDEPGTPRTQLVAIDSASGERQTLADDADASFGDPAVSYDGTRIVCVRRQRTTYTSPPLVSLWLIDLQTGVGRELVADPDIWPAAPVFCADDAAIFFLADELGHRPVFRLELGSEQITRLTTSGHFDKLQVAADGETLYALRDSYESPARPVRLSARAGDAEPAALPCPGEVEIPGRLERLVTRAADGTEIQAWLALPDTASPTRPAPLLLWVHGGPLSSWNGWTWRWNPWLMVARGYAVLLPDPALSTGYGARMIERGWGEWGGAPFTDLMTVTDVAVQRADIDETRTAAMGGSYGGYMANWIAGHTDRFRCIVTHASLWALDQFQATTDVPGYWVNEWGLPTERPERYDAWSPHHFLADITTPMLVIHGDKDYRVPIGEALRLWTDLQRAGVESMYLYFPDEGHWILKPGNARVWYETVWSFLAQHVDGVQWAQPALL